MALERMDRVGIIVDDLAEAIAFFTDIGLELDGKMVVEGELVDRIVGLEGVSSKVAMMQSPDGRTCLRADRIHLAAEQ